MSAMDNKTFFYKICKILVGLEVNSSHHGKTIRIKKKTELKFTSGNIDNRASASCYFQ